MGLDSTQTKSEIVVGLKDYNINDVERYASYIQASMDLKDKSTGKAKNPFLFYKTPKDHIKNFKQISDQGLMFDGKHITLQSVGISLDYVAYKNKMLLVYPETKMDFGVVYKGDDFTFRKESGKVIYLHEYSDPFNQNDENIIGCYCVIKNSRGEFITLLDKNAIAKHRKVARGDTFWDKWFVEMVKKTVIKKACKDHFDDVYTDIETIDNTTNIDIENPLEISVEFKSKIDALGEDKDKLREAYAKNKGDQFKIKYILKRVADIEAQEKEQADADK